MQTNRISSHFPLTARFTFACSTSQVPTGFAPLPPALHGPAPQSLEEIYRWAIEQAHNELREKTCSAYRWN